MGAKYQVIVAPRTGRAHQNSSQCVWRPLLSHKMEPFFFDVGALLHF
ncbi:hypothetical protein [Selenomonas artemidis]